MRSFVIFSVANQSYGIDIEEVKRILPFQTLTDIPDEADHVEGMFQYEEEVLKVLSFRKMLGLERIEKANVENQRFLILAKEDEAMGVNIDKVEDIIHVEETLLHKAEHAQRIDGFMNIEAILEYESKLVTIIKDINFKQTA